MPAARNACCSSSSNSIMHDRKFALFLGGLSTAEFEFTDVLPPGAHLSGKTLFLHLFFVFAFAGRLLSLRQSPSGFAAERFNVS